MGYFRFFLFYKFVNNNKKHLNAFFSTNLRYEKLNNFKEF